MTGRVGRGQETLWIPCGQFIDTRAEFMMDVLMKDNKWARLLAVVTGLVNQKLLLQNEYLAAENRILRAHLPARMRLSDPQRSSLAEIAGAGGRRRQLQEREM